MNLSNGNRDVIDWLRTVSVIITMLAVFAGAVLYISGQGDEVFHNLDDPRFPWNHEKAIVLKRISDNESDLDKLLKASQAQRDSILSLQTATQNILQTQRELTESIKDTATNMERHLIRDHDLYFQDEKE